MLKPRMLYQNDGYRENNHPKQDQIRSETPLHHLGGALMHFIVVLKIKKSLIKEPPVKK